MCGATDEKHVEYIYMRVYAAVEGAGVRPGWIECSCFSPQCPMRCVLSHSLLCMCSHTFTVIPKANPTSARPFFPPPHNRVRASYMTLFVSFSAHLYHIFHFAFYLKPPPSLHLSSFLFIHLILPPLRHAFPRYPALPRPLHSPRSSSKLVCSSGF